ncbi:7TM diverse intracellular signaling domain-containing protein [Flammeovirga pectinis]|nr:7TM diverse intracellular signaling domain-containing protein [Flammeovirga pectinis]
MLIRTILITLLFILGENFLQAQPILLEDKEELLISAPDFTLVVDSLNSLSIDDIVTKRKLFKRPNVPMFVTTDTSVTYWIKMSIDATTLQENSWVFEILDSHLSSVEAYLAEDQNYPTKIVSAGYNHHFGDREFEHKNITFPLRVGDSTKIATVYLCYKSEFNNVLLFKVSKITSFLSYALNEYLSLGLFYGTILCLLLVNFILFLILRERYQVLIIFYLFSVISMGLSEDNLASQYLWVENPVNNYHLMKFSSVFFTIAITFLSINFLKIKKYHSTLFYLIWVVTLGNIIYFLTMKGYNSPMWNLYLFGVPFAIIFYVLVRAIKAKRIKTWYFFIGYSTLLLQLLALVLKSHNLYIFNSILTVYSFNVTLLIVGLLITMSQFDKFKKLKDEKEAIQIREITTLKEQEKVIEQKVVERTQEVEEQKEIVFYKNKELEEVNDLLLAHQQQIALMNQQLEKENRQLHNDVEELATARVMLKEVSFEEFENLFPDDNSCYEYLEKKKWENGYSCKKCNSTEYAKGQGVLGRRCKKCNYNESVTSGTIFHRLHFPIEKAFRMLFIVFAHNGEISTYKLSEDLDLRQNTCWKFKKKIDDAMQGKEALIDDGNACEVKGWDDLILG